MNQLTGEDEQVQKLKAWWKQNGFSVVSGAVLALALAGGYNWWDARKLQRSSEASELFVEMVALASEEKLALAADSAMRLVDNYGDSDYAAHGAQLLARIAAEKEDWEEAAIRLQWVIDTHKRPATVHAARLRLARILIVDGDLERAAQLVEVADRGGFVSHYLELDGDILAAQDDPAAARAAYEEALASLPSSSSYRSLLQLKLREVAATGE